MKAGEAVAKRVNEYITERKITLYRLAKDGGIAYSTLKNIYRPYAKSPTLTTIMQIARGLGVTLHEFLREDLFNNELELE